MDRVYETPLIITRIVIQIIIQTVRVTEKPDGVPNERRRFTYVVGSSIRYLREFEETE